MDPVIEISLLVREIVRERVQVEREPVVLKMWPGSLQRLTKAVQSVTQKIGSLLTGSPSLYAVGASSKDA